MECFGWHDVISKAAHKRKKKERAMCVNNDAFGFSEKAVNMSKDDAKLRQGCFSPARATFRYIGMILMCLAGFGSFFCYDNPGALEDYFLNSLDMSTEKFVMLYSIYSWPNIISCFVGGFLVDRVFGIRCGTVIYATLTLIGHVIFAAAVYVNAFWLMMVGRFLFGIGGESLSVALDSYFVLWFKGKELNTVFGMQLCVNNVASSVNFLIMENIYSYVFNTLHYAGPECIGVALYFAALTCLASVISVAVLTLMDIKAEKVLSRNDDKKVEIMKLKDVKGFRKIFWLISLICVAYSITIYPFLALAKVYFITKYELEQAAANNVTSLMYTISAVACPIFGILVDKTGNNILWIIVGIIGTFLAHSLLAFTYVSPNIVVIIFGVFYSIFESSFWTLIALVVPEHQLGTAYGTVGSLLNLGLAVAPMCCGTIVDKYGYFMLELFFLFSLLISLVSAFILWVIERNDTTVYSITG